MTTHPDILTLTVNGRAYRGWTGARVSRGLDRCATDFELKVTERWLGQDTPWQILPFAACVVKIDDDVVMTGYVDDYLPEIAAREHAVRISGRSRTQDLIDCTPDLAGGQFSGYTLAAIARAVCALFGIGVVDQSNGLSANTFADATLERGETGFSFLERLGRLSGVLLSDDANGNLVLATVGATRASGRLAQGDTILAASGVLSGRHRFSEWIVKGQHALGVGGSQSWGGAGGTGTPAPAAAPAVQTQQRAVALDPTVPRYRPRIVLAESMLTGAGLQLRANWLRQQAFGAGTRALITVQGWRQPDGTLWQVNQIVPVTAPALGVDQDLLIVGVEFAILLYEGRVTRLRVAPVAAFTPDPGAVKLHKKKGTKGKGGAPNWTGAGGA